MAGYLQRMRKNASSLYTDPYKWGVVKGTHQFNSRVKLLN